MLQPLLFQQLKLLIREVSSNAPYSAMPWRPEPVNLMFPSSSMFFLLARPLYVRLELDGVLLGCAPQFAFVIRRQRGSSLELGDSILLRLR